jgi:hypothetical protein
LVRDALLGDHQQAEREGRERAVLHRMPLLGVGCEVELQSVGDLGQVVMVTIISESAACVSSRIGAQRGRWPA